MLGALSLESVANVACRCQAVNACLTDIHDDHSDIQQSIVVFTVGCALMVNNRPAGK